MVLVISRESPFITTRLKIYDYEGNKLCIDVVLNQWFKDDRNRQSSFLNGWGIDKGLNCNNRRCMAHCLIVKCILTRENNMRYFKF